MPRSSFRIDLLNPTRVWAVINVGLNTLNPDRLAHAHRSNEIAAEVYQKVLRKAFQENHKDCEDPHALGVALYELYPPTKPIQPSTSAARSKAVGEAISETHILFEPVNELGVVMIFGILHKQLGFPYIGRVKQAP